MWTFANMFVCVLRVSGIANVRGTEESSVRIDGAFFRHRAESAGFDRDDGDIDRRASGGALSASAGTCRGVRLDAGVQHESAWVQSQFDVPQDAEAGVAYSACYSRH